MKKIIAILLMVVMIIPVTGCGKTDNPALQKKVEELEKKAEEKKAEEKAKADAEKKKAEEAKTEEEKPEEKTEETK